MSSVKLLLKEKIRKLGDIGDLVTVKAGYARNYLLPKGLAILPSIGELKRLQKIREKIKKEEEKEKLGAEEILKELTEKLKTIVITAKSGESDKLFGSITTKDILENIQELTGIQLERKQIILGKRAITELGKYTIKLKLHPNIETEVKLIIKKEE